MDLSDLFKSQNVPIPAHQPTSPTSPKANDNNNSTNQTCSSPDQRQQQQLLEQTLRELDLSDQDSQEGDQFPDAFIDKGELTEISNENQDILLSPHTSRSGSSSGDDDYNDDSFKDSFTEEDFNQEIDGLTNFKLILEYPELDFEYHDTGDFFNEINDWFNFTQLKDLNTIFQLGRVLLNGFNDWDEESKKTKIFELVTDLDAKDQVDVLRKLVSLLYIQFGVEKNMNQELQKQNIIDNSKLFLSSSVLNTLLDLLKDRAKKMTDIKYDELIYTNKLLKAWSKEFFYLMTIIYFQMVVFLTDEFELSESSKFVKIIADSGLLVCLTQAIDRFRWLTSEISDEQEIKLEPQTKHSKPLQFFQLKNVIMLLNQTVMTVFGNIQKLNLTKDFLKFKHNTEKHSSETTKPEHEIDSITPFDYMYYRNELVTRYPTYTPPEFEISNITESIMKDSQTISGSINTTSMLINQHHNFKSPLANNLSTQQPPVIHLATPMPSPTLIPQHTGSSLSNSNISELEHINGETRKKLFVTQPNFPNIHPFKNDVPFSIKEASNIFYNHIKEDVSSKQFISIFESFIKEEQGIDDSEELKNMFKYSQQDIRENPMFQDEIESLIRVEHYYENCLPYFGSLVAMFMQIISSNVLYPVGLGDEKIPLQTRQKLQQQRQRQVMGQEYTRPYISSKLSKSDKERLEILRNKEITLKCFTMLLVMLLKWFKVSHVLKFEYLNSLIFDADYFRNLINFLDGNKFGTQFSSKNFEFKDPDCLINNSLVYSDYEILNKFKEYNFFRNCCGLRYVSHDIIPETGESIKEYIFKYDELNQGFYLPMFNNPASGMVKISRPNLRHCMITTNLLKLLYYNVSHFKVQRIYKLLETRPTDIFRFYLTLFNKELNKPILKIIKLMSPFSGKKWRSNNMDLISFVYLFYKVKLKDSWLSNFFSGNLEERLKKSYENEHCLRSLLIYYNKSYANK